MASLAPGLNVASITRTYWLSINTLFVEGETLTTSCAPATRARLNARAARITAWCSFISILLFERCDAQLLIAVVENFVVVDLALVCADVGLAGRHLAREAVLALIEVEPRSRRNDVAPRIDRRAAGVQ